MADRAKALNGLAPDALRRRSLSVHFGVFVFKVLKLLKELIEVLIGDFRFGLNMVKAVMPINLAAELQDALGVGGHVQIVPPANSKVRVTGDCLASGPWPGAFRASIIHTIKTPGLSPDAKQSALVRRPPHPASAQTRGGSPSSKNSTWITFGWQQTGQSSPYS